MVTVTIGGMGSICKRDRDELERLLRSAISTATNERVAPEDIDVQFQEQVESGVSCSIGGIKKITPIFNGVASYVKHTFLDYLSYHRLQLGPLKIIVVP